VLVVSAHDESIYAEIAFRAGALGLFDERSGAGEGDTRNRRVLSGSIYVSDALAAKMLQRQVRGQTDISQSPVSD